MKNVIEFLEKFSLTDDKKNKPIGRRIWLNVTDECDLCCVYCSSFCDINKKGKYSLMSFEIAKNSIETALNKFGVNDLKICFFGGEPLLNFELIKKVVKYCENKNNYKFTYGISTNAIGLTKEVLNFFNEKDFFVQISIDGPLDIQKKYRPLKTGGTFNYDNLENIIRTALSTISSENIIARGTFTSRNLNLSDNLQYYLDLGFKNVHFDPNISRNIEELNLTNSINAIEDEINKLVMLYFDLKSKNKINRLLPISDFYNILTGQGDVHKCEGGEYRLAYDVDGNESPCHMVANFEPEKLTRAIHIRNTKCNGCVYRKVCSGVCLGAVYYSENDYELQCKINRMYINSIIKYVIPEKR